MCGILLLEKKFIMEVVIVNQDQLTIVENEKLIKNDLLSNKL